VLSARSHPWRPVAAPAVRSLPVRIDVLLTYTEDHVAHVEYGGVLNPLDSSNLQNLTQHVMQARDNSPWNSKRTMFLGIGNDGQSIGTLAQYLLFDEVRAAVDKLCPKDKMGFSLCDKDTDHTIDLVPTKDKKGNLVRSASFTINIGANYWGVPGLREVLACVLLCL
jgi:hypothetical protein